MAYEIGVLLEDLNNGNVATSIFATSTTNGGEEKTIKASASDENFAKEKKNSLPDLELNKELKRSFSYSNSRYSSSSSINSNSSNHSKNAEVKLYLFNNHNDEPVKDDDKTDLFLDLNKIISYIHSFILEFISIYLIIVALFVAVYIGYSFKNEEPIQEDDGKWRYGCPLFKIDLISNLIEFFFLIYLIVRVIKIWNFIFVFKCVKFIGYSVIVWISLGPLANMLGFVTVFNNGNKYLKFNIVVDTLCYLVLLVLFIWDRVYYTLIKQGTEYEKYFYTVHVEKCLIHKSYSCGCTKYKINPMVVMNFINFYKFTSKIISINNGHIKYYSKQYKNSIKFFC